MMETQLFFSHVSLCLRFSDRSPLDMNSINLESTQIAKFFQKVRRQGLVMQPNLLKKRSSLTGAGERCRLFFRSSAAKLPRYLLRFDPLSQCHSETGFVACMKVLRKRFQDSGEDVCLLHLKAQQPETATIGSGSLSPRSTEASEPACLCKKRLCVCLRPLHLRTTAAVSCKV